jgi:hypothetical protein
MEFCDYLTITEGWLAPEVLPLSNIIQDGLCDIPVS